MKRRQSIEDVIEKLGPVVIVDKPQTPPSAQPVRSVRVQGAKLEYRMTVYPNEVTAMISTPTLLPDGTVNPVSSTTFLHLPVEDLVAVAKLCAAASGWAFDLRKP